MKIQIDEDIYSGSAVEIMEQLRQQLFDTGDSRMRKPISGIYSRIMSG